MIQLTAEEYDQLGMFLNDALCEYDPTVPDEIAGWNAVRGLIARFCVLFEGKPGFDYWRFLTTAMNGCP